MARVWRWLSAMEGTLGGDSSAGWIDSCTRQAFSQADMQEWAAGTRSVVEALGARSVLDIGCGDATLAASLLARKNGVSEYWGTDFSALGVEAARGTLSAFDGARVLQLEANDFSSLPSRTSLASS